MKLKEILKTVGPSILSVAFPAAAPAIAAVNSLITGKPLPDDCTGDQLNDAISGLSPEIQAKMLDSEYEYKIELIKAQASAMNTANTAAGENYQKTRAFIAKWSFVTVSAITLSMTAVWASAVLEGDQDVIREVASAWPMVVAFLGPFFYFLNVYMGVLKEENRDRLNANNGKTATSSFAVGLSALMRQKK